MMTAERVIWQMKFDVNKCKTTYVEGKMTSLLLVHGVELATTLQEQYHAGHTKYFSENVSSVTSFGKKNQTSTVTK